MLSTIYVTLLITTYAIEKCRALAACPEKSVYTIYDSTNQFKQFGNPSTSTSFRLYELEYHSRLAFHTTVDYAQRLRVYTETNKVKLPPCIEEVLYPCVDKMLNLGVVTQLSYSFHLVLNQENMDPQTVLRDILIALKTYRAAGIVNLYLNSDHLREAHGQLILLTGPVKKGSYHRRLKYYAPEVLKDSSQVYPNSDAWFAGVAYFTLVTSSSIMPASSNMYGRLHNAALTRDEDTLPEETKRQLKLITYYALQRTWSPNEGLSDEENAIMNDLEVQNYIDPMQFELLRYQTRTRLELTQLSEELRGLLHGLLTVNHGDRLTPENALKLLPLPQ